MKKTLVIGASEDTSRYAYLAINMLQEYGYDVVPLGKQTGSINGTQILTGTPELTDIDTVTLYINPKRQAPLYDYISGLKPKRVIFNPGTENREFENQLKEKGIEVLEACTLVMLRSHQY